LAALAGSPKAAKQARWKAAAKPVGRSLKKRGTKGVGPVGSRGCPTMPHHVRSSGPLVPVTPETPECPPWGGNFGWEPTSAQNGAGGACFRPLPEPPEGPRERRSPDPTIFNPPGRETVGPHVQNGGAGGGRKELGVPRTPLSPGNAERLAPGAVSDRRQTPAAGRREFDGQSAGPKRGGRRSTAVGAVARSL